MNFTWKCSCGASPRSCSEPPGTILQCRRCSRLTVVAPIPRPAFRSDDYWDSFWALRDEESDSGLNAVSVDSAHDVSTPQSNRYDENDLNPVADQPDAEIADRAEFSEEQNGDRVEPEVPIRDTERLKSDRTGQLTSLQTPESEISSTAVDDTSPSVLVRTESMIESVVAVMPQTLVNEQAEKGDVDRDSDQAATSIVQQSKNRSPGVSGIGLSTEALLGLFCGIFLLLAVVYGPEVWSRLSRQERFANGEDVQQSLIASSSDTAIATSPPIVPPQHTDSEASQLAASETATDDAVPIVLPQHPDIDFYIEFYSEASQRSNSKLVKESDQEPAGVTPGEEQSANDLNMKLVWCPPGKFMMGSPARESGRHSDEEQVAVTLTQGFWLGKYEVTRREWRHVMGTEPWNGKISVDEFDQFPATYVSWDDAIAFCRNLTVSERASGQLPNDCEYTLPTEAQWEYACRASTTTSYGFGDDAAALGRYGWFRESAYDDGELHGYDVGIKRSNRWNLHDMHGNVWEWCQTWYGDYPDGTVVDPAGPKTGSACVIRGGSWFCFSRNCRTATRHKATPDARENDLGFRVAICATSKSGESE